NRPSPARTSTSMRWPRSRRWAPTRASTARGSASSACPKAARSALMAAHERQIAAASVPAGLRYALHVPFYPACVTQYWQPRTSGAPIRILTGANDTYVGLEPCQTYAAALRAGGADIELIAFPGAAHGFDFGSRAWSDPRGE